MYNRGGQEKRVRCPHEWLVHSWVFIAQLVKHCSTNAEAMGLNPVKVPKLFFGFNLQLLLRRYLHLTFKIMSVKQSLTVISVQYL